MRILILGCTRNAFFAGALWFLTAIFLIRIVFIFIKKFCNRWMILLISYGVFLLSVFVVTPIPIQSPHGIYNWDSAMYYLIFYSLGYILFPYIRKFFDVESVSTKKHLIILILTVITFVYSAGVYFGHDMLNPLYTSNALVYWTMKQASALIMILGTLFIAYWIRDIKIFCEIGRDTLNLCGSEWLIKKIIPLVLTGIGLTLNIVNPLQAFLYTIVCLFAAHKLITPLVSTFENALLRKLVPELPKKYCSTVEDNTKSG